MSTTEARSERRPATRRRNVDLKLEVVVIPVSDVDRAKPFYEASAGGPTPTSPSATPSASSSSRLPARAARSRSARA